MDSAGMTRWQHFRFAIGFAYQLEKTACVVFIHAIAPRYFKTYGSDKIKELHKKFNAKNVLSLPIGGLYRYRKSGEDHQYQGNLYLMLKRLLVLQFGLAYEKLLF